MRIDVWKLFCRVKNQSLSCLLPLLFLLKCISLIIGPKNWFLLHELKGCIQHLIWELNIGHLWSLFLFSFGGLGGGLGGGWWHFLAGLRLLLSDFWPLRNFRGLWLILCGWSLGLFSFSSSCLCFSSPVSFCIELLT